MITPADIIRREIGTHGVLSFARFMELALYCPDIGYYETKKSPGRRGDFYTSVSVGELFGQLLACQFSAWLDQLKARNPQLPTLNLCEAGAHDGTLAKDILNWLQSNRPELFTQIEYIIPEPSSRRREWQKETLKNFAPQVRWLDRFDASTVQRFNGIIFSNELLDAMPVHRFGWDTKQKKWFEWGVTLDGYKFIWSRVTHPASRITLPSSILQLPSSLLDVLPDNYTVEISPAAENWWGDAARSLERGWLVAFDYGLTDDELLSPSRMSGTLRAYFQHRASDDVLANPGQQDITAHVNFLAIQKAGEAVGFKTEFFGAQSKFLTQVLAAAEKSNPESFRGWDTKRARQFQTLTHPEHLGRAFKVMVQSR